MISFFALVWLILKAIFAFVVAMFVVGFILTLVTDEWFWTKND